MKFRKVVKMFLAFVADSDRTDATLRHYTGRIKRVRQILGDRHIEKLTLEEVEKALTKANQWPDGRMLSPDTRRANATVLQQVFAFAVRRQYLRKPLFDKLERPRARNRERIPTDEENEAIERVADAAFRVAFRALRQCGARPGELAKAQIENWERSARLLVIRNHKTMKKTGRPRQIGVGEKLESLFVEAIGDRTSGPIFLDKRGKPWTTAALSTQFRRFRRLAGLPDDLCLYLQRHYHATKVTEKLGIEAASQALGHSNISTTMRYNHPDKSRLSINQDMV